MHPLYSVAEIRGIEQAAAARLAPGTLMQRAGRAGSAAALELIGNARDARVLVLAGPGNNGGDAFEVAAHLAASGMEVYLVHLPGAAPAAPETAQALERARAGSARFVDAPAPAMHWSLVVDGLFGIGLKRPLEGAPRALVEQVNTLSCPILALDVPSGLDADTGAVIGPDGVAVRATHTVCFIGDKAGLHTSDGPEHCGRIRVAPLEIGAEHFVRAHTELNEPSLFSARLRPRARNAHKGSHGSVAVIGGARGMSGAPLLAARAALFAGAGRVYVAALHGGLEVDPLQPELMFRSAAQFDLDSAALVVGPGMGTEPGAAQLLGRAIDSASALLVDADGLNLLAASPDLQARLAARNGGAVLTPHPLEAARMLGVTCAVIQHDRLAAARELAARMNAIVVLKGAGTVVAGPDGRAVINPTGNPGLATAGSGDVLAGIAGSLLAQGWPAWECALAAVWIHGSAADRLVEDGAGPIGLTAGELPRAARALLNEIAYRPARTRQATP